MTTFFKLANLAGVTIQSQVGISLKAYTNLSPASAHRIAICACEVASPEKITPPITPQLPVQQFHRDYAGCHFFGSRTEILTKMVLTKSETLQAVLAKPKQIPVIITADCEQNRSKVVLQNRDRSPGKMLVYATFQGQPVGVEHAPSVPKMISMAASRTVLFKSNTANATGKLQMLPGTSLHPKLDLAHGVVDDIMLQVTNHYPACCEIDMSLAKFVIAAPCDKMTYKPHSPRC